MMLGYIGFRFILLIVVFGRMVMTQPNWSDWIDCEDSDNCFRRRILKCGTREGIHCTSSNTIVEPFKEEIRGCENIACQNTSNLSEEVSIFQQCRGDCYDAISARERICSVDSNCTWIQFRRCRNLNNCSGTWTPRGIPTCSVTCGTGTTRQTEYCVNATGGISYNCNGTNGNITNTNRTTLTGDDCNTHACPKWSSWSKPEPCSVTCGNGVRKRFSACSITDESGFAVSNECPGSNGSAQRFMNVPCNAGTCPVITTTTTTTTTTTGRVLQAPATFPVLPVAVGVAAFLLVVLIIITVVILRKRKQSELDLRKSAQNTTPSNENVEVDTYLNIQGSEGYYNMPSEETANHTEQDAVYAAVSDVTTANAGEMKVNVLYIPLEKENQNDHFQNGFGEERIYDQVPIEDSLDDQLVTTV